MARRTRHEETGGARIAQRDGCALFEGAHQPKYRDLGLHAPAPGPRRKLQQATLEETPFWTLRRFARDGGADLPPMLVVPPISGLFPALLHDLLVGLLADFRLHVLDWANVRHVPLSSGRFGFDDNLRAIAASIRRLGPDLSVLGICQGGVPSLAAVADIAARTPDAAPAHLVLMGAPVDPAVNPTALGARLSGHSVYWYQIVPVGRVPGRWAGASRWVYPAETQLAALHQYLLSQLPAGGEIAGKLRQDDGIDPLRFPFLDLVTSVMDIDARHFAENIDRVFLRRDMPRGRLFFDGRRIDPSAIRDTTLLTIEGARDDIAAPGQTSAAHGLCAGLPAGQRQALVVEDCGHFSLFHGEVCRRAVLPAIRAHCRGSAP